MLQSAGAGAELWFFAFHLFVFITFMMSDGLVQTEFFV